VARRIRFAPFALLAGFLLAACDATSTVVDPLPSPAATLTAPSLARVYAPGKIDEAETIIGPLGGTLTINGGAITLVVPPGAVLAKTRFAMHRTSTVHAQVELTATSLSGQAQSNDVGSGGFLVPVLLHISYGETDANPWTTLVAEVTADGELLPVKTVLDLSLRQVVGLLPHFSGYVMASN
jgi:hypothetical protein